MGISNCHWNRKEHNEPLAVAMVARGTINIVSDVARSGRLPRTVSLLYLHAMQGSNVI